VTNTAPTPPLASNPPLLPMAISRNYRRWDIERWIERRSKTASPEFVSRPSCARPVRNRRTVWLHRRRDRNSACPIRRDDCTRCRRNTERREGQSPPENTPRPAEWGLWSKRRQVKTATGQNGDTETATEMAIFKTATNPNNTYNSSEVYITDRRACNC